MKRAHQTVWLPAICLLPLGGAILFVRHNSAIRIETAHEAIANEDRLVVRQAMQAYTEDKGKPPQTLEDLVDQGYLKNIPKVADLPLPHRNSH